jgi:hypothetical protein
MKAISHRTTLSKETAKLINNTSTAFFSKPYAIKSIPSWTITRIVQGDVAAM